MSTQHLASVQRVHSSHVRCPLLINCVGTMQMFGSDAFADAKLLPLQKQFTELPMQPETARCNLDTVLQMAAEAHNVPLSDIIPLGNVDKSAVASLKQLRSDFIGRIIVFRSGLLPLSRNVVNGLHSFLDYLEDEGDFLELAKAGEVSRLCSKHADEAQYVQEGYEALASDLLMMGKTMNDSFEKVGHRQSVPGGCLLLVYHLFWCLGAQILRLRGLGARWRGTWSYQFEQKMCQAACCHKVCTCSCTECTMQFALKPSLRRHDGL